MFSSCSTLGGLFQDVVVFKSPMLLKLTPRPQSFKKSQDNDWSTNLDFYGIVFMICVQCPNLSEVNRHLFTLPQAVARVLTTAW